MIPFPRHGATRRIPVQQRRHRGHAVRACWNGRGLEKLPPEIEAAVRSGLRDTRWPGRLESHRQNPLTVIDVGHTPDAIRQSLTSLKQAFGAQAVDSRGRRFLDKKDRRDRRRAAPSFDTIICTSAHHKGGDARRSPARAGGQSTGKCPYRRNDPGCFQPPADTRRFPQPEKIYVAWRLFTAIEFAAVAHGICAKDLDFF